MWLGVSPAELGYSSVSVMFDAWERNSEKCQARNFLLAAQEFEYFEGSFHMAKGDSNGKFKGKADGWKGFRNIDLSASDKEYLVQNPIEDAEVWELLGEVVAAGHRITFSKKADKPAVVVTFTGSEPGCANIGYSLSSYAPTFRKAVVVNLYKHIHLSQGKWAEAAAEDDDEIG
jgi:hypothetical protein